MKENTDINMGILKKYGVIASIFHAPLGLVLAKKINRFPVSPNAITVLSLIISSAGCILLFAEGIPIKLIGFLAFHLGFVLDYTDGQLARLTGRVSEYGAWLDNSLDRFIDFLLVLINSITLLRDSLSLANAILCMLALFVVMYSNYVHDIAFFRDNAENSGRNISKKMNPNVFNQLIMLFRLLTARDVIISLLSIGIVINMVFEVLVIITLLGIGNILIDMIKETWLVAQ